MVFRRVRSIGARRTMLASERFAARVRESERPILVLHSPAQMLALAPAPGIDTPPAESRTPRTAAAAVPAKVLDLHYVSDSLSFRYDAPGNGYLLVTDRWAPGWEASVNGRKSPVWGADFIFRAVEVASGSNVVEFSLPASWLLGPGLSQLGRASPLCGLRMLAIRPTQAAPRFASKAADFALARTSFSLAARRPIIGVHGTLE